MKVHELKCWPQFFDMMAHGEKNFEIRKNDRDFADGDTINEREWNPETQKYTGRTMSVKIIAVIPVEMLKTVLDWWNEEFVVMSLQPMSPVFMQELDDEGNQVE